MLVGRGNPLLGGKAALGNKLHRGPPEIDSTSPDRELDQNSLSGIAVSPQSLVRVIIESMHELVVLIDRDFRVLEINAAALRSMGLPADTKDLVLDGSVDPGPITDDSGRLLSWEDSAYVRAMRGETVVGDVVVRNRGGRRRYVVNAYPLRGDSGDVEAVLVVGDDVTAFKDLQLRTHTMLRTITRQERALRTVIENMPAGLLVVDYELRLLNWNQAFVHHFGSTSEWLAGRPLPEVAPGTAASGLVSALRSARDAGSAVTLREHRFEGPDGITYWNASIVPIEMPTGPEGPSNALVLVCVDVTEEKHTRERLRGFYAREHAIAEKLQTSFMVSGCPTLTGFELGHRYKAGSDEALVGGDFYDVFQLGAGRLGLVIGDVSGKGLKAAVYTGMTKYMLRAYALEDSHPESVLYRLNEALNSCTPAEVFVTLAYAVLDERSRTLHYANAGHEPPIHRCRASGLTMPLDVTGRALALTHGSTYATRSLSLPPGDLVLFYTDGITEAGSGSRRLGPEELLGIVRSLPIGSSAQAVADRVLAAGLQFAGGVMVDDAAVLAIRALDPKQE